MKRIFSFEKKDIVFLFLLLLFISDCVYSYYQHALAPVDGDLPSLVAPSDAYRQVLTDPFGFKILKTGGDCAASNRFFIQWLTYTYFRHVPLILQNFLSPIDSVYTSMAIGKTFIQIGLILLMALYVCITFRWKRNEWMLAALIICPLFQAVGFFEYLCMIDNCISYAFAYAFSTLLLMIFLFPYYRAALTGDSGLPAWLQPLWLLFPIVLAFSGPLTGPVLLIVCPSTLLYFFHDNWRKHASLPLLQRSVQSIGSIDNKLLLSFGFTTLLCLYSFYIGTHNSENSWEVIPWTERYHRLLEGLIKIIPFSEGLSPILLALSSHLFILYRSRNTDLPTISRIFFFASLFVVVYLLLLPLGGYRSYRPYIIRRDTLQPVLWILFFAWGLSSVYLIKYSRGIKRAMYASLVGIFCLVYTAADKMPWYTNECERESLKIVASSTEECVELHSSCTVMQWVNTTRCEETIHCAKMLHLWNITSKPVYYRHKP